MDRTRPASAESAPESGLRKTASAAVSAAPKDRRRSLHGGLARNPAPGLRDGWSYGSPPPLGPRLGRAGLCFERGLGGSTPDRRRRKEHVLGGQKSFISESKRHERREGRTSLVTTGRRGGSFLK